MASLAASGLVFPGARAPVIRTVSCSPLRPAAPSPARLPAAAAATAPARAPLRSATRPAAGVRLRCAPSSGNTTSGPDGGVADEDDFPDPPWWAPSFEELKEFEETDFSPEAIKKRYVRESKEAAAAVKGAAAGLLARPLRDLFDDVRKLKTVYDVEEFHICLPIGALMSCVAAYHLCKAAPSAFVDFVLHYAFYRLCVMAADVRRRGFATDFIIRLKLFITVATLAKGFIDQVTFLNFIARYALFAIYYISVSVEVYGLKKYRRFILPCIFYSPPPEMKEAWDSV
nr:uncharacterized protein LOC117844320 [Setaria viridis]